MVSGKKERNLKEKTDARTQRQKRRIPRLTLHSRNHCKPLLPFKDRLNHGFLSFEAFADSALFFLPRFGLDINRQDDEVDH